MLLAALRQDTSSVSIDILTSQDLESMRASTVQHQHATCSTRPATPGKSDDKRYLILTYISDFERVQYPLPLRLADGPTDQSHIDSPQVCTNVCALGMATRSEHTNHLLPLNGND